MKLMNDDGVDGVTDVGWQGKEHQETAKSITADRQTAQSINHSSHAQPARTLAERERERGREESGEQLSDCLPAAEVQLIGRPFSPHSPHLFIALLLL